MRMGGMLAVGVLVAAVSSGCGLTPYLEQREPSLDRTIQAAEPSQAPSSSAVATPDFSCQDVPVDVLSDVERIGNVGGSVRFHNARMVPAGDQWWAVAVRVWVDPHSDYDPDSYGDGTIQVYITNAPSHPDRLLGSTDRPAPFRSQASAQARKCVESLANR